MGRNPKTIEEFVIPKSMRPAFRPSKALRDAVADYAASPRNADGSLVLSAPADDPDLDEDPDPDD